VAVTLALAGVLIGCSGQTPAIGSASPSTPVAIASASADDAPTATAPASSPAAGPPQASLAAEGGDPVIGQLGSFTWTDGGSDSPWLPGAPVTVGEGEPLTVALGDGVAIAGWTARRVPAGTTDGAGAVGLGGGPAPARFAAPAPGSWSVQVDVTFAGDLGTAVYYWQVSVR
jgi:hypothetical protein